MSAAVEAAREALVEMVAEADEKLMEKFFDVGTLGDEELITGLRGATASGKLFPLVCTSALQNVGIQPLLDWILAYLPSPQIGRSEASTSRGTKSPGRPTTRRRRRRSCGKRLRIRLPAVSRCSGWSRRRQIRLDRLQQDEGCPRASRASGAAARQDADDRSRDQGGRPWRGRQAQGHPDERHDGRQVGSGDLPTYEVPRAGAGLRDRTQEPR